MFLLSTRCLGRARLSRSYRRVFLGCSWAASTAESRSGGGLADRAGNPRSAPLATPHDITRGGGDNPVDPTARLHHRRCCRHRQHQSQPKSSLSTIQGACRRRQSGHLSRTQHLVASRLTLSVGALGPRDSGRRGTRRKTPDGTERDRCRPREETGAGPSSREWAAAAAEGGNATNDRTLTPVCNSGPIRADQGPVGTDQGALSPSGRDRERAMGDHGAT